MRIIKFRCWDKGGNRFLPRNGGYFESNSFIYSLASIIDGEFDDLIIQQFTGLKDKNGKEIYEGDVCHAYKANSYLNGNYEVVWDNKRGRWAYKGNTYQVGSSGNLDCEVIGNVFQNNDLL